MANAITITDKNGKLIKKGDFSEPEIRLVARAGYRVFKNDSEITQSLTGLFDSGKRSAEFHS